MKKVFLSLISLLLVVILLASCVNTQGGTTTSTESEGGTTTTTSTTTTTTSTTTTTTTTSSSQNNDPEKDPTPDDPEKDPSDDQGGEEDLTYVEYVDGVKAEEPVQKGNYVVYVKPSDDSVWFAWDYDSWTIKNKDEKLTYEVYFFSVDALFDSYQDLKEATELSENQLVGTKSRTKGVGKGAAIYKTTTTKLSGSGTVSINNMTLFGSLVPFDVNGEKIVTVEQFGAVGDSNTFDHTAINNAIAYPSASVIEFESMSYLQGETIWVSRDNVRINAKGAHINNDYSKVTNRDFQAEGSASDRIENVTVENLVLYCTETTGKGVLYKNYDHFQFEMQYTKNLTVRNCKFIVPAYTNLESDLHITSLSLRDGINTLVEGNTIENQCGSDSYSGGLWFWSDGDFENVSSGIVVRNNYILKSSHDEVLAFFNGAFDDILVEDNTIITRDEPIGDVSAHAIGFGVYNVPTTVSNVIFRNNKVDVVCEKDLMMFSAVKNIEIYNNTFIARNNSSSESIQYGVFRVTYDSSYEKKGITVKPDRVMIYNNTVTVYNTKKVPLNHSSCGSGFTFYNNDFKCIIN